MVSELIQAQRPCDVSVYATEKESGTSRRIVFEFKAPSLPPVQPQHIEAAQTAQLTRAPSPGEEPAYRIGIILTR